MRNNLLRVLLLLLIACNSAFAAVSYDPMANADAVVTSGNVRFTVLTPRMIRIQYSATKKFEDRATFAIVNRKLETPSFQTTTSGGYLYITTEAVTLRYLIGSTPKESDKSSKNLCITFDMNGEQQMWYPGKGDELNLLGTTRTLDRAWGDAQRPNLEKGILSRAGWSVIDESPRTSRGDGSTTFALEAKEDGFPWWSEPVDKDATDWYFMAYGHDYKAALKDFTRIAGNVPMPPKYIFGYWYSRYWGYTQNEFIGIINAVEKNDIPMDVLVMDMDWHKSGWTGWSWNKSLIPNPTYLINYMHDHGLKTTLNLHPSDGVASYEDNYAKLRSDLGIDASSTETIPWKLDDYDFYKAFFKNIMRPHESEGVDFWWLDWQQWLTSPYTDGLSQTFWLNHVYFEDMQRNRPDLRPVIYHRWGGLGSHRYPICFSGDTYAAWSTIAYEIPFTSMASNVCYAYWGHDLGGHQGGNNDPELLQRWLQFGVFSPIFRTHATNDGKLERRIWMYSNFKQLRETVRLRYRLFPYLYTAARETYDTGVGMNRPLYYDYPEAPEAYVNEDEYMFGNDILVAPIYEPAKDGISKRKVWLPEGAWWDASHGKLLKGGRNISDEFTLDEFPYYYKAGSIIINYPTQRTVQTTPDTLMLKVVPGAEGKGQFYEDNGTNQDYKNDAWAMTTYSQTRNNNTVTLTIEPRKGSFEGAPEKHAWKVEFLGQATEPESITLNGTEIASDAWAFDPESQTITVTVPTTACSQTITISVTGSIAVEAITEGTVPTPNNDTTDAGEAVKNQLWALGSAVPGGSQQLEAYPDGSFRFHGSLLPGKLYIANTDKQKGTTRYCAPSLEAAGIVTEGTNYTTTYVADMAVWNVPFAASNYRFTVNPTAQTVKGELFTPWYESWIVGGCTASGQMSEWLLDKGIAMTQSSKNPYEWTWVGELNAYTGNTQNKMFKINGQYDWNPKSMHPFAHGTSIIGEQKACTGTNDNKWQIAENGYYEITVNVFRETISGRYLGTNLPEGVTANGDEGTQLHIDGRTVTLTANESIDASIYNTQGVQLNHKKGDNISFTFPAPGVYIVKTKKAAYKVNLK